MDQRFLSCTKDRIRVVDIEEDSSIGSNLWQLIPQPEIPVRGPWFPPRIPGMVFCTLSIDRIKSVDSNDTSTTN